MAEKSKKSQPEAPLSASGGDRLETKSDSALDEKSKEEEETKTENKTEEVKKESGEKAEEPQEEEKKVEKSAETSMEKSQPKAEKPKTEKTVKKAEPSGKFKNIIKDIESLTVLELSELVRELEDRFGVSAAAPVAIAATGDTGTADGEAGASEGKAAFDIELASSGEQKINVIKALREINPDLGLKEAKDIVDAAPKVIKQAVKKEEAEKIKKKLEAAGGKVNLK
ncbi:MAG: 50S ribosomal protein L7/L12 [bacterium]